MTMGKQAGFANFVDKYIFKTSNGYALICRKYSLCMKCDKQICISIFIFLSRAHWHSAHFYLMLK